MSTLPSVVNLTQLTGKDNDTNLSSYAILLYDIAIMLWKVLPPMYVALGTFGNVMIVVVMRGMRGSQSIACLSVYFTALAVSDQGLLMTLVLYFWVDTVYGWPPSFFRFSLFCKIPRFVWYVTSITSAWFLVTMTFQRVTSILVPHRVGVLCTVRRGRIIVAAIVVVSCVLNVHLLFTASFHPEYSRCLYLKEVRDFMDVFTWLDLIWGSMIPFLLLIIGNSVLIVQVIQSLQLSGKMKGNLDPQSSARNVNPMARTLILVSVAFLIQSLPMRVFDVYRRPLGVIIHDPDFKAELDMVGSVAYLLWFSTSASNFYLYVLSGKKFREGTIQHLCCCYSSK